jgi:hypothetical protein
VFFDDFETFLEQIIPTPVQILITGDFNWHLDDVNDTSACKFLELLEAVGLQQHVHEPTHDSGHILDPTISRQDSNLVSDVNLSRLPSDHRAVICYLDLQPPAAVKKKLTYRKLREINIPKLTADIKQSSLCTEPANNLNDLVLQFDTTLLQLLDSHAPVVTKTVTVRSQSPWFSDELRDAKQQKRRAERKYTKSHLEVDKQIYKEHCRSYKNLLDTAKADFHRSSILDSDTKDLFRIIDKLSNPNSERTLPKHESMNEMADRFADYFDQKIK